MDATTASDTGGFAWSCVKKRATGSPSATGSARSSTTSRRSSAASTPRSAWRSSALVAEGHLLIEDVPGVGKTMLAKAMARSIDCSFRRIQFTPDMLPTDITGVNVFNQERGDFEFRPGAVFANIVLGDEINRASPKTQSALLECMEERQVTIDAETHTLGTPFMVDRHAEPRRARGHLSPARGAARPVHDAPVGRLPRPRRSRPRSWPATASASRSPTSGPSATRWRWRS